MPIRWSALKVSEAADIIQEHVTNARAPLELAREEAKKALLITNLPQYVSSDFYMLIGEIDRAIGGGRMEPEGRLNTRLKSIRDSIPEDKVRTEQKAKEGGDQQSLM